QPRPGDQCGYICSPPGGCTGQASVPARSLRQLLAMVERAREQPLVSDAAHLPPVAQWRMGARHRSCRNSAGRVDRLTLRNGKLRPRPLPQARKPSLIVMLVEFLPLDECATGFDDSAHVVRLV